MKLSGVKHELVEIEYNGSYSDLISNIFQDIFKASLKSFDNILIKDNIIEFQHDISLHGTPYYETHKSIKKEFNENKFNLAVKLINLYNDLQYYKGN